MAEEIIKDEKTTPSNNELEELKTKLDEATKKSEEYLNNWKRERADFINYKKDELERTLSLIKEIKDNENNKICFSIPYTGSNVSVNNESGKILARSDGNNLNIENKGEFYFAVLLLQRGGRCANITLGWSWQS